VRALGIDVGVGKGLDVVVMDERRAPSMLWRRARDGKDAIDELRRRSWEIPPEMR
jgi:hypothetical protein